MSLEINGAGATFPFPLYQKMFQDFSSEKNLEVTYRSIGSGGGMNQLLTGVIDFAGTDYLPPKKEIKNGGGETLFFPTCLGAVAITYNIEGTPELKMTGDVIASIFLGEITYWNDKRILELNPDVKLPDIPITVVSRSDGSGTTYILSDYLSKVSEKWKEQVGKGKSLFWSSGVGGRGNAGVVELIKRIPGAIGYAEMIYALSGEMPVAKIKNKSGNYIYPDNESISAAANISPEHIDSISITDTPAEYGYPISSFSWIVFFKEQKYNERSFSQAKNLKELFLWTIENSFEYTSKAHYGTLPLFMKEKSISVVNLMTYNSKLIE
jgi:phosphate transport system substrate-binding protein